MSVRSRLREFQMASNPWRESAERWKKRAEAAEAREQELRDAAGEALGLAVSMIRCGEGMTPTAEVVFHRLRFALSNKDEG
jgi:hypothetical protein